MSSAGTEPRGDLATALGHAARLLEARPELAAAQAREILAVVPAHPEAELILAAALRRQGETAKALEKLAPLANTYRTSPNVQFEYGSALFEAGRTGEAISVLRRAVRHNPKHVRAWRLLGDALTLAGDSRGADAAYASHIQASVNDPRLLEAAAALCDNRLAVAEQALRGFLKQAPTDVAAIRMLAEVAARLGRYDDAALLLERALELAPGFDAARYNYAAVLSRQNRAEEALKQVDMLIARDPRHPGYRTMKAAAMARIGEYHQTIALYAAVLAEHPHQPKAWMSYGHALKTVGRTDDGIAAYRRAVELMPHLGEAWWSLANLKTFRFAPDDIAVMQRELGRGDLSDEDRLHLDFALGKALEDAGDYAASFAHYAAANACRRVMMGYEAEETSSHVERARALFTPEFFAARQGAGCEAPDPIFIVGLTRSGSTLVEQILSSHSEVEGTMELPDIAALAKRLGGRRRRSDANAYPEVLAELSPEELQALGAEYLERTRVQRKLGRPFFIDKMPNNWAHAGLIHLILPQAKIIDARRHPLACCFSNFKQHFARGQGHTYSLSDLGRYYRDYVAMMAQIDTALPGRVHRVFYEDMVADPEGQTRALLEYCGLPFEDACLRFYENSRAVRTASSEQVRRPIFTEGLAQWRHYEPWLDELKAALGEVLNSYPAVPAI